MKWLSSILFLFLLVFVFGFGFKPTKITSDAKIDQLVDSLPKNWYVKYSDTLLTFICRDSVYRIWTNHINEPGFINNNEPTEEEKMTRFKKEGKKKEGAFLSFRLKKKWSDAEVKKANASNQKIYKQLKALPSKYKIEHLYDAFASHKGTPTYRAKTESDKKKVDAYEAEKVSLEAKIIRFPAYCSSSYSIYNGKSVGMNSAYEDIYPAKVSEQAYHIINLANEIWDCNSK